MQKILVVDDDQLVAFSLSEMLRATNYEVIIECDSSKVLDLALKEMPDIICLDLMMPQPTGFELTRMIRKQPVLDGMLILIVTALDNTHSRITAIGAGANGFLAKPFNHREFSKKIQDLLHGKKLGIFDSD